MIGMADRWVGHGDVGAARTEIYGGCLLSRKSEERAEDACTTCAAREGHAPSTCALIPPRHVVCVWPKSLWIFAVLLENVVRCGLLVSRASRFIYFLRQYMFVSSLSIVRYYTCTVPEVSFCADAEVMCVASKLCWHITLSFRKLEGLLFW